MVWRIVGSILFVVGMAFYVRFAWRKSERDWEYIQESNRKHNEWMIQCGKNMQKWEQERSEVD